MTKKRYRKLMMAMAGKYIQMAKRNGHYTKSATTYTRYYTPDFTVLKSYQEHWDKVKPIFDEIF